MHVHIAFAGDKPEPTINTIKAMPDAPDLIVILYGKNNENDVQYLEKAEGLQSKLKNMMYECEIHACKTFDFLDIVDTIYKVYEKYTENEKKATFSVDITTGTNLMSAAACNTAFFTNATVYYMKNAEIEPDKNLKELLIHIPSPKIPDTSHLGEDTLDILRYIEEKSKNKEYVTNSDIGAHFGDSPQLVKYHTDRLLDFGLVERVQILNSKGRVNKRVKPFQITREGRFVLKWK